MIIAIKVRCPVCSNKRLMDLIAATRAELEIKCPKCGRIIHLTFIMNRVKAKAI